MTKPNFFIIGAPKCGTTSLAAWLSEHPQIYMSAVKEPHHFNTDHNYIMVKCDREYEKLFEKTNEQHLAIGEASVMYLYSRNAVLNIERYTKNAKYIVCIRNPVEMAHSWHEQLIVSGYENETNFEVAWHLQNERNHGCLIPKLCREPAFLAYGLVCSIGHQLELLYKNVQRERVFPLLLDDVKNNPQVIFQQVLEFLNIEDDGRTSFLVHNSAKTLRSPKLRLAIRILGDLKRLLGIRHSFGVLNTINHANIRYRAREPMSKSMSNELENYFQDDINKLSDLLGRDLSHWCNSSQVQIVKNYQKENTKC